MILVTSPSLSTIRTTVVQTIVMVTALTISVVLEKGVLNVSKALEGTEKKQY